MRSGINELIGDSGDYTTFHIQRKNKGNNDPLMAIPGMGRLEEFILTHAEQYGKATNLKMKDNKVSMWGNIYRANDQHEYHCHPNSLISGTFYVYTDKDSSEIIFQDPAFPQRMFDNPIDNDARHRYNGTMPHYNNWECVPTPGTLMMWPSYILHRVRQQKKGERVTVSFNVS
jgi:uncharacterized protein (TIGR02466 family)